LATTVAKGWKNPKCTPGLLSFIHQSHPDNFIKAACLLLKQVPVTDIDFRTVIEIFTKSESDRIILSSLIPILELIPEGPDGISIPDTVSVAVLLTKLHSILSDPDYHGLADLEIATRIIIKLIGMIPDTHLNYRGTLRFLTSEHSTIVQDQVKNVNDRIPINHLNLGLLLDDLIEHPAGTLISQEIERIIERIPSDQLDYDKIMAHYNHEKAQESHRSHALQLLKKMDQGILIVKGHQILAALNSLT
jgi:hypothetical protein